MTTTTAIRIETPKRLSPGQELELARRAKAAAPESFRARRGLAQLLLHADQFAEALELLDGLAPREFGEEFMRVHALLAHETPEHTAKAAAAADTAYALAETDRDRAQALADRGKAELRLQDSRAPQTLAAALGLDPHNRDACKRLAAYHFGRGDAPAVAAMTAGLEAAGVGNSRMFAARMMALVEMGDLDAAHETVALDRFLYDRTLAVPPGWECLDAFNAALTAQLLAHPGLRYDRYGTASELTWRIDTPLSRAAPLVAVLLDQIKAAIAEHLTAIAQHDHAWLRAQPEEAQLHCWSVITDSDGFETWHVHQSGWLSGVYYVQVPESIATGRERGGCIALGLPDDLVSPAPAEAFGERLIRPHSGKLLMFPSHTYHRTFPHGLKERRICVAFDLQLG